MKSSLPKYEKWSNYEQYLPGNIERVLGIGGHRLIDLPRRAQRF